MYDFFFFPNHLHGQPRLNSMKSSPWMLLWGVCFIPARLDIRQIKGVKRQKQSRGVISPQAQSLSVNTPQSSAFANNVTSPLRQTISYDTVSAAWPSWKRSAGARVCGGTWTSAEATRPQTGFVYLPLSRSLCAKSSNGLWDVSVCFWLCACCWLFNGVCDHAPPSSGAPRRSSLCLNSPKTSRQVILVLCHRGSSKGTRQKISVKPPTPGGWTRRFSSKLTERY